jgi:CRISPR-associated protein Cas2
MSRMVNRFMRVLVFFDLPVTTKKRRRAYAEFRKILIKDGFTMLQYSVYSRVARNSDDAEKHKATVRRHLPPEGSVRVMLVTEKQYASMDLLLGEKTRDENFLDTRDVIML